MLLFTTLIELPVSSQRFLLTADYTMAYQTQSTNTIQVTVLIAGRPYLLTINKTDEALIHRLAKEINNKVATFQANQPSHDLQDCFALALLTYAVESYRLAQGAKSGPAS